MMKSLKRMVLTGAGVAVFMSFAIPAMAQDPARYYEYSVGDYNSELTDNYVPYLELLPPCKDVTIHIDLEQGVIDKPPCR